MHAAPRPLSYSRTVQVGEPTMTLEVPRTGDVQRLDTPVPFEVPEGRIVGQSRRAPPRATADD